MNEDKQICGTSPVQNVLKELQTLIFIQEQAKEFFKNRDR